MAWAPTNIDSEKICGQFQEKEYKGYFEYSNDASILTEWDRAHDATHRIFVGKHGEETRPAKVLKTVAYIMYDENRWEKWNIKQIWER